MRDSFMHDTSLIAPSVRWFRAIVIAFCFLGGSISMLSFIDGDMGDTSCGGG